MEFSHPPPDLSNQVKLQFTNPNHGPPPVPQSPQQYNSTFPTNFANHNFNHPDTNAIRYRGGPRGPFKNFNSYHRGGHHPHGMMTQDDFDGKRLRKSVMRKTVDYNASIIKAIEVSTNNFFRFYLLKFIASMQVVLKFKLSLFIFRIEYGKETIGIGAHYSLKVSTLLI